MSAFFLNIFRALWHRRVTGFWPIWSAMTIATMLSVAWFVGRAAPPPLQKDENPIAPVPRQVWSRSALVSLSLLVLFLSGYIVMSLKWEDFADYDDAYFTLITLRGHNVPPIIWPDSGRFFPLELQEFNLIRHFTGSLSGYHVLPIAQLLVLSCILLILDDELSVPAQVALAASVLILPGIVTSFTGLVFPERNFVFWLGALVVCVARFDRTGSTVWAVGAATSAQIMLYYKETAFVLLWGFAVARIVLRCKRANGAGWEFSRLRDKQSRLDLCLVSLGVLFLLYYVAAMIPHLNMQYANDQRFPITTVLLYYLRLDLLAWLFVGVVLRRTYLILQGKVVPSTLWDGLAWGAVVCFIAYLYLRLTTDYYLAPVDVIAVLYVGRFTILSWGKMPPWSRTVAAVLASAVLAQSVSISAFRMFERKNAIHAKVEIADVIVARYQSGAGNAQRLFFPFADVYPIIEFASYLTYRGVSVQGVTVQSAGPHDVVLVMKGDVAKDGPCVSYRSVVCHTATSPRAGDLAIELPDDDESLAEISPFRNGGELLLSYQPRPRIPQWLYPFVNCLRVASVRFEYKNLPDRWLHASVTAWR